MVTVNSPRSPSMLVFKPTTAIVLYGASSVKTKGPSPEGLTIETLIVGETAQRNEGREGGQGNRNEVGRVKQREGSLHARSF